MDFTHSFPFWGPIPGTHSEEEPQRQTTLNAFEDFCRVEPFALLDREGSAHLVVPARNANAHLAEMSAPHVTANSCGASEVIEVATTTLDAYTSKHPMPQLIKMDIEGGEVAALSGARKLLSSVDGPTLLISTHSADLESSVKALLVEAGYMVANLPGFHQMLFATKR